MMVWKSIVNVVFILASTVQADFSCICNYNVESAVYASASKNSTIGYMYEFDCKPEGPPSNNPNWVIVQYEKKYGYMERAQGIETQVCPGAAPDTDVVTTTAEPLPTTTSTISTLAPTTTTTTTANTTTTPTPKPTTTTSLTSTTTTPMPTTTTIIPTTSSTTTPNPTTTATQPATLTSTTPIPTTTTQPTTTTTTRPTTTTTPKPTTTTHPTTTSTPQPTTKTTTQLPTTTTILQTTTTTPKPTTTTTTPIIRTTPIPTTTHMTTHVHTIPTTTTSSVRPYTQVQYGCPKQYTQHAQQLHGAVFTLDSTCYELVLTPANWKHAEADCVARGGHLAHIPDQRHQDAIYQVTSQHLGHDVWIGLNDKTQERHHEWSSGDPVIFTNWIGRYEDNLIHGFEDCVGLGAKTKQGRWDDFDCSSHLNYLCEFRATMATVLATTTAMPQVFNTATAMPHISNTDGDIGMCPGSVTQDSRLNNYPLAQYGDSCYELQTHMAIWFRSETLCTQQGGHMVAITSAAEQAFVNAFMARHNPEHAVWIGLHDRTVEDQFEWTSGESVSYTNWVPNHRSNFESHNIEDCVALIPYQSSKWDDIPCGQHDVLFGGAVGEKHYALCEYKVVASHGSSVLVG